MSEQLNADMISDIEDMIETYIRNNLTVEVSEDYRTYSTESRSFQVKLRLGNDVISRDSFYV